MVQEAGDFNPFTDRGWQTLHRRFAATLPPGSRLRILDVGCGTGNSRSIYESHAAVYAGIDLSLVALRRARRRGGGGHWLQADACAPPFAAASFDVVAFSSVLHHIDDRTAALREAYSLLRPGGRVFAFDPNLLHPAMALFRHPRSPFYIPEGVSPHERPLLPGGLARAFREAGFTALGQRCQSDIPFRRVAPRRLDRLLAFYNLADRMLARSRLDRWFGSFVVTWGRRPR